MTSPAALVLYLALVCSSVNVISEKIPTNSTKLKSMRSIKEPMQELVKEDVYDNDIAMKTRTNLFNIFNYRLNYEDKIKNETDSYREKREISFDNVKKYDEIHTENDDILDKHLNIYTDNVDKTTNSSSSIKDFGKKKRIRRYEKVNKCDSFTYEKGKAFISHPHIGDNDNVNYSSNTYCTTVISGSVGYVVQLTFIDMFHIEEHPECEYDYLEVRDGDKGYYNLLGKVCGEEFPAQITTTGPYAWLKFYSDDTIEYKGFRIQIDFVAKDTSYSVPESCVTRLSGKYGRLSSKILDKHCNETTKHRALDYLWSIHVPGGYQIYLNFTTYAVQEPNECDKNFVQVYGSVLEYDANLAHYCGSVATPVSTAGPQAGKAEVEDEGNIMHVRLYAAKEQKDKTVVNATFTAFRTLDLANNNDTCDAETEFDCQDNTCIDIALRCNSDANCKLKADEEKDLCKHTTESLIQQPQIQTIVSIFCVILSGIILVFLYKCSMKLYKDHKIIKEQMNQSCEDRLDDMIGSQLMLDAKRMQSDCEPRASQERDNQTNEMFKEQRKFQQKVRPTSIDSDFMSETYQDLREDLWQREENGDPKAENVRTERSEKARRKVKRKIDDMIIESNENVLWQREEKDIEDIKIERKERKKKKDERENLIKKEDLIRRKESEERIQISEVRDVSVGVPDTKQSGCQTRDSLFQTAPIIPSNASSSSNNRGSSKFGYSGASIIRPSPPQIKPSDIVIEVIIPNVEEERKTQKKILADRRPMSAETTRSAPDVIILAKP